MNNNKIKLEVQKKMLKKFLVIVIVIMGFYGCAKDEKDMIADFESKHIELTKLNNDLEEERSDFFKLIREYNSTQSENEQFDITKLDTSMGIGEKELLQSMFKEEKDISYNGLLSNIIEKNNDIALLNNQITDLNDQIVKLEDRLPKAYTVQNGDTHYKIVRDYLVNQYGLDKKQAREIAWKTVMTDNLLPGNRIWLTYDKDQSILGTYVTQGDAKIAPMSYEQIAKRIQIQKAIENSKIADVKTNLQVSSVVNN